MDLKEIRAATLKAKAGIWSSASRYGREPKIYLHWTAGNYDQTFSDYHLCIKGDGSVVMTRPLSEIPEATWHRNSGSVAIALCCALGAEPDDMGDFPPTSAQIECAAQLIAVIADALGVDIDLAHVMTHAEAADNLDGEYIHPAYGPDSTCEKWDLLFLAPGEAWWSGGDTLRGKAKYYRGKL